MRAMQGEPMLSATIMPPAGADAALRAALLESRQRWRDALLMAVDFVFETDLHGRFSFVAPEVALGHPAANLLGRSAAELLLDTSLDPFAQFQAVKDMRVWLRHGQGGECCVALCLAPLMDEAGRPIGLRGTARDITAEERAALSAAAALRRTAMLNLVMSEARREQVIERRMQRVLEGFLDGVGCQGLALVDWWPGAPNAPPLVMVGDAPPGGLPALLAVMPPVETVQRLLHGPHEGPMIVFGVGLGTSRPGALVAWRQAEARRYDSEEVDLLNNAADIVNGMRHHALEREALTREARTDPLTGLLNRRSFVTDLERRLQRAARLPENAPGGALIYVDLDNFKPLNDAMGHAAGDIALKRIGALLRDGVRPSDLVGRLGGDEFAAWLDGADERVAAFRAEALHALIERQEPPLGGREFPLSMSIGIAAFKPGTNESVASLLERADAAMYTAKRGGRGRSALAEEEPPA